MLSREVDINKVDSVVFLVDAAFAVNHVRFELKPAAL